MIMHIYKLLFFTLALFSGSSTIHSMTTQHTELTMVIAEKFTNVPEPDPSLDPVIIIPTSGRPGGLASNINDLELTILHRKDHILCSDRIIEGLQKECAKHVLFFKQHNIVAPHKQIFINKCRTILIPTCYCNTNLVQTEDDVFFPDLTEKPCYCNPLDSNIAATNAGFYNHDKSEAKSLYYVHAQEYLEHTLAQGILETEYDLYATAKGIAYCKLKNTQALFNSNLFKPIATLADYKAKPSTEWTTELDSWYNTTAQKVDTLLLMGHGGSKTVCTLPHATTAAIITSLKNQFPCLATLGVSTCFNDAQRITKILGNNNLFSCIISKAEGPHICSGDTMTIESYDPTTKTCVLAHQSWSNDTTTQKTSLNFNNLVTHVGKHVATAKAHDISITPAVIKALVTEYQNNQSLNKPSVFINNKPLALLLAENK